MIRRASSSSTGGGALACALGHSFDVAKEGHVNLMVGRGSRATGDTAEMLAARRRFLNAGHYTDASNVANALIARGLDDFVTRETWGGEDDREESETTAIQGDDPKLTPRRRRIAANKRRSRAARPAPAVPTPRLVVVDFGCGEGWWLARAIDAATEATEATEAGKKMKMMKNVVFAAIDASPAAARLAARILPPDVAEVAVADVTGTSAPAPLADASVAVALSVFAPRKPSELSRVLRPNGVVVVVSPGDDHLAELREPGTREALGVLDVAENKRAAVAEAFETVGFVAEGETTRVTGRMALKLADLRDVVGMGPSAFHGTEESQAALETFFEARGVVGEDGERRVRVTKSFVVQCFRKPLER